jgi:hypothetical protein
MKRLLLLLGAACALTAWAQTWAPLAQEGQAFTVPPATTVRYGAGTAWISKVMAGAGQCTNAFFGSDPIKMTRKVCEIDTTPIEVPPPVLPTPQPAPPSAPPTCWPAQVGGAGSTARTALIVPADAARANPGTSAPPDAEPVHALWWYCPDALEPTGWRSTQLLCAQSGLAQCIASLPILSPQALTAAWSATPPRQARDVGLGWAGTVWRKLYDVPPPPPPATPAETWVVAKAPSTAKPAGTRPLKHYTLPSTLIDAYATERAAEGTPCDCARFKSGSGASTYCHWGSAVGNYAAVCVKQ